jgi:UDP-glucose 4-epimerase
MKNKVLVTGGAGYIGSHVVRQMGEAGYDVVVYDNCSTGSPTSVLHGELIIGDLADTEHLYQVFAKHQFSAVLHFAASLSVPESVVHPLDYYGNNTRNTLNLLRCCSVMGVNQIIFSRRRSANASLAMTVNIFVRLLKNHNSSDNYCDF